jgi:ubiquitin thioesterase protein OTUB1
LWLARSVTLNPSLFVPIVDNGTAVAFSYFEALVRIGDPHKFLEEETRLKSLCNILNDTGFVEDLYEDFMEDTIELLRKTANAGNASAVAVLLETFNDPNGSMSIITYLKAGFSF